MTNFSDNNLSPSTHSVSENDGTPKNGEAIYRLRSVWAVISVLCMVVGFVGAMSLVGNVGLPKVTAAFSMTAMLIIVSSSYIASGTNKKR